MYNVIMFLGGDFLMSVRKNFRLDSFTNAMLEEIAVHLGKTQTEVVEQLIRDYIVFEMDASEGKELLQRASEKLKVQETELTE